MIKGRRLYILIGLVAVSALAAYWAFSAKSSSDRDRVSDRERAERLRLFSELKTLVLPRAAEKDFERAFELMRLTPAESEELYRDLIAGPGKEDDKRPRRQLLWITMWDTNAEDVDVVSLRSGSYRIPLPLTREPRKFPVLLAPDGTLSIVAVRDGDGGGITVGVVSAGKRITLPVLEKGESLQLTVEPR